MKRFNNILCVVEPNDKSIAALTQAVKIAKDNQAKLTIVSILKTSGAINAFFQSKSELYFDTKTSASVKHKAIGNWVKEHYPQVEAKIDIYAGISFIEIVKNVIKHQFDLVIKCADEPDWLERLFGSDDMHILRKCPCPILMLKSGQKEVFRNVLATVDVNKDLNNDDDEIQHQLNKKVLEYSTLLSVSESTKLHIGSVWEAYGEDFLRYGAFSHQPEEKVNVYVEEIRRECSKNLELLIKEMSNSIGKETFDYLRPKTHLIKGRAPVDIPSLATQYNVDLIVMGTVARTGVPGFIIGNTAESILEQVKCSVLAIKPDGFISPIY